METSVAFARVGHFLKSIDEASGLSAFEGIEGLFGNAFEFRQMGGHAVGLQILARLGVKGVEKNRLGVFVLLVEIQTRTAPPLGDSDLHPIGSAVAGSLKVSGIDEGFSQ